MTGTRNKNQETNVNCQESLNGNKVATKKRTGGVENRRETSKARRRRADNGICIKAHHHSLTIIMESLRSTKEYKKSTCEDLTCDSKTVCVL
jgi:hypothetical protein